MSQAKEFYHKIKQIREEEKKIRLNQLKINKTHNPKEYNANVFFREIC